MLPPATLSLPATMDNTTNVSTWTEQTSGSPSKLRELVERMRKETEKWRTELRIATGKDESPIGRVSILQPEDDQNGVISLQMSEAYWTLGELLRPSSSPVEDTIDKACYHDWFTKAKNTLLQINAPLKLPGDIWPDLLNDANEVCFEVFASSCASRNKPIVDTALTREASLKSWALVAKHPRYVKQEGISKDDLTTRTEAWKGEIGKIFDMAYESGGHQTDGTKLQD